MPPKKRSPTKKKTGKSRKKETVAQKREKLMRENLINVAKQFKYFLFNGDDIDLENVEKFFKETFNDAKVYFKEWQNYPYNGDLVKFADRKLDVSNYKNLLKKAESYIFWVNEQGEWFGKETEL